MLPNDCALLSTSESSFNFSFRGVFSSYWDKKVGGGRTEDCPGIRRWFRVLVHG